MKHKHSCRGSAAAFLLALGGAMGASTAWAQSIEALQVNADAGLQPGSVIEFSMKGTPNGIARVQVQDSGVSLPLRETERGHYVGRYTVRNTDGLKASKLIRGELTVAGNTTHSNFRFPPSFAQAAAPAPVLAPAQAALRLDRFSAPQVDRLLPGTELKFAIEGSPGAFATVRLPGLGTPVQLQEQRPGQYTGSYVLRRDDAVTEGPVIATLRSGERTVTAQLARPLASAAAPATDPLRNPPATMGAAPQTMLPLQVTAPGPNAAIDAGAVVIQGRTAPGAVVQVRVDAVAPAPPGRSSVAQSLPPQTVQADASGNFSFNLGPVRAQPGTRFEVNLSAAQGAQAAAEQRLVLFQRS